MIESKKYYQDLYNLPKRISDDQNGISPKATIIQVVCIYIFKTPDSEQYPTKTYWPLNLYFGIKDFETPDDDRICWVYADGNDLSKGYWFTQKEFNHYFRIIWNSKLR